MNSMKNTLIPSHRHDVDIMRGRDMLCFSHDWNGDPLSKTHLMRLMARNNRVLWINSIGYRAPVASRRDISRAARKLLAAAAPLQQPEPNIYTLNPLVIPAYGRAWVRDFNRWFLRLQVRRAMRKLRFQQPINWVFNPAAAIVAGSLGEEMLIYYCVDEYTAFSGVAGKSLALMERELLAKAEIVFVSSDRLCQSKGRYNPRTVLVRHGVDYAHFRTALDPQTQVPEELKRLPGPVIGYFGLIAQDWVDLPLIAHVAQSLPSTSIVMLGKITMDVTLLKQFPNVHLLGRRPYQSLPAYCRGFDVAMIPFPINEVTVHANPLKLREYLAAGLPVVSTAIPEVEAIKCCHIARGPAEFATQIKTALLEGGPSAARSDAMRDQSWDHRLEEIVTHLHGARGGLEFPTIGSVRRQRAA